MTLVKVAQVLVQVLYILQILKLFVLMINLQYNF